MDIAKVGLVVCAAGSAAAAVLRSHHHPAADLIPPFVDFLWVGLLAICAALVWAERRRRDSDR